ncbi:type II toxin-antitoxin system VapC family toxin [bacterium]|nr:type II toxin-antitoxin system VapC family toxin [bacterium]
MIIPDVNLLIHAYSRGSKVHQQARRWWESELSRPGAIGLPWVVALGFIRLTTHRAVMACPLSVQISCQHVRSWLARPQILILHPGERHAEFLFGYLEALGSGGNLTTDAHLAALASEYQAELQTTDADFARFPGLKWRNPLK